IHRMQSLYGSAPAGERQPVGIDGSRARQLRARFAITLAAIPAFVALFVIHWRNSRSAFHVGAVPPDLGYSPHASTTLQVLQLLCLAYLFGVYIRACTQWRIRLPLRRDLALNAAAIGLLAW